MTKTVKSFIYEGKEIDFPFEMEVELIESRADTAQVIKNLVDAYNEINSVLSEVFLRALCSDTPRTVQTMIADGSEMAEEKMKKVITEIKAKLKEQGEPTFDYSNPGKSLNKIYVSSRYSKEEIKKDIEELMDLANGVCSIASSECCGDGHGKFWTCEECSCQDGYLDHDENGKAFFHKLGTCDIHRCSQKINELIEKGYNPWKKEESENV